MLSLHLIQKASLSQLLMIAGFEMCDRTLDRWQNWCDRVFADVQPEILSALSSICWVVGWVAGWVYEFSRHALATTWGFWLEESNRAALWQSLIRSYTQARALLHLATRAVLAAAKVVDRSVHWALCLPAEFPVLIRR